MVWSTFLIAAVRGAGFVSTLYSFGRVRGRGDLGDAAQNPRGEDLGGGGGDDLVLAWTLRVVHPQGGVLLRKDARQFVRLPRAGGVVALARRMAVLLGGTVVLPGGIVAVRGGLVHVLCVVGAIDHKLLAEHGLRVCPRGTAGPTHGGLAHGEDRTERHERDRHDCRDDGHHDDGYLRLSHRGGRGLGGRAR